MSRRLALFASCVTVLLFVLGCSHMQHLLGIVADKPQVRLRNVEVKHISTKKLDLDFILEVYNPNSFSVDIEQLNYSVSSLDLALGQGQYADSIALKSKEKVEVRLPFQVDSDNLVNLMKRYLQNPKELKVLLKADLYLDTALGKMDLAFEEDKTILRGFAPL